MPSARVILLPLLLLLAGCGDMGDDLFPSGDDRRPVIEPGTSGPAVGQQAPDFSVPDTSNSTVTLASALEGKRAIVLYFSMWCPICDSHLSNMVQTAMPDNPDVAFYAVDYVSGSVQGARDAMYDNGFADKGLTVLADTAHTLTDTYQGTMGITIVIDSTGVVRMNEDYREGSRLRAVLASLP